MFKFLNVSIVRALQHVPDIPLCLYEANGVQITENVRLE